MRYATFVNFTSEPFVGYWNGRPYTFKPKQKKQHLNEMIARHFAKHLANRELTKAGMVGYCSPKKPLEVPQFMEVFNKAFSLEGDGREYDQETGLPVDGGRSDQPTEPGMNVRMSPRSNIDPYDARSQPQTGPDDKPQIVGELVEGDDESTFEGAGNN